MHSCFKQGRAAVDIIIHINRTSFTQPCQESIHNLMPMAHVPSTFTWPKLSLYLWSHRYCKHLLLRYGHKLVPLSDSLILCWRTLRASTKFQEWPSECYIRLIAHVSHNGDHSCQLSDCSLHMIVWQSLHVRIVLSGSRADTLIICLWASYSP